MKAITIIPFFISLYVHAQEIGEKCGDSFFNGKCVLLEDCDHAIAGSRLRKIPPTKCDSLGDKPIVCCQYPELKFKTFRKHCIPEPHFEQQPNGPQGSSGYGGVNSFAKEFPHMSALGFGERDDTLWGCGGTLISSDFVLTAAHCLISRELGPVKYVRLGDLNLKRTDDNAKPQDFTVKRTFKHPDYHPPVQYNDIALIQLDREAIFDDFVQPACLNGNPNDTDKSLFATGWGRLGHEGELAEHLQKMSINLVPEDVCKEKYEKHSSRKLPLGIVDSQMCAGAPRIDTCAGDSGGPLQAKSYYGYVVHGITSFGVVCALTSTPGVYTKISSYIDWIDSIVWPNRDNFFQDV